MSSKIIILILIFIFCYQIKCQNTRSRSNFPSFLEYIQKYNKNYSQQQSIKRQILYWQKIDQIILMNCQACGINNMTDWKQQQIQRLSGTLTHKLNPQIEKKLSNLSKPNKMKASNNPVTFDWRILNKVTSPKDQGDCGACWSFGTAGFFQSDLIINDGENLDIDLSEQFLISCQNKSFGCDGGFPSFAMQFVIQNGGMPYESKYSYLPYSTQPPNMCQTTEIKTIPNTRKLISYYKLTDQQFLKSLIIKKPVNIGICSQSLLYYSPTITSRKLECNPLAQKIDHNVLVIGYRQTQWIIKNSWGTNWGIDGYGYISRNQLLDCCISTQVYTTGNVFSTCSINNCEICVEQTACHKCKPGYFVRNSQSAHICYLCPSVTTNCKYCQNYYGFCNTCNTGYSLDYPKFQCIPNTDIGCSFSSEGNCLQCYKGYSLMQDDTCKSDFSANNTNKISSNNTIIIAASVGGCAFLLIIGIVMGIIIKNKYYNNKQTAQNKPKTQYTDKLNNQSDKVIEQNIDSNKNIYNAHSIEAVI